MAGFDTTVGSIGVELGADVSGIKKGMQQAQATLQNFADKAGQIGKVAAAAFAGFAGAVSYAVAQLEEGRQAEIKLAQASAASGKAIDVDRLMELAGAMSEVSIADDDAIASMFALQAGMGLTETQIATLAPRVLDLAAYFGQDLSTAGANLARAANGQAMALRQYGIVLSEDEQKAFRAATANERLAWIMAQIESRTGGAALALTATAGGALTQLKVAADNAAGAFGELFEMPIIVGARILADALRGITAWFGSLTPSTRAWATMLGVAGAAILALVAGLGLLLAAILPVVGAIVAWGPALLAAGAAIGGLVTGPMAAAIMAMVTFGIIIAAVVKHWDLLVNAFTSAVDTIVSVGETIWGVFEDIWDVVKSVVGKIQATWARLPGWLRIVAEAVFDAFTWPIQLLVQLWIDSFKTLWIVVQEWGGKLVAFLERVGGQAFEGLGALKDLLTGKVSEIAINVRQKVEDSELVGTLRELHQSIIDNTDTLKKERRGEGVKRKGSASAEGVPLGGGRSLESASDRAGRVFDQMAADQSADVEARRLDYLAAQDEYNDSVRTAAYETYQASAGMGRSINAAGATLGKIALGFASQMGTAGQVVSAAMEGMAMGGPIGAVIAVIFELMKSAEEFMNYIDDLSASLKQIAQVFNPIFKVIREMHQQMDGFMLPLFQMLSKVITTLMNSGLKTLLHAFGSTFAVIAGIIRVILTLLQPVFVALGVVFRGLGIALQAIVIAVSWVGNAIIDVITEILWVIADIGAAFGDTSWVRQLAINMRDARINMPQLMDGLDQLVKNGEIATELPSYDEENTANETVADKAYGAADGLDKVAESSQAVTESLSNVPTAYKVALARMDSALGVGFAMGRLPPAVGETPVGGGGMTVNIQSVFADDPASLLAQLKREADWRQLVATGVGG